MTDTVGYATLQIIPSTKGFTSALSTSVRAPLTKVGTDAGSAAGAGYKKSFLGGIKGVAGPLAALIGVGAGIQIFGDMIGEAREAGRVSRQTAQLIKTTGGAANLTASQVGDLATRLSEYAAVDDELVQSGENVLLTFKNVQNQVGAGNDIFSRATKAALDMSTVLGSDLNGAVLQLGKALNDPIKGVTSLGRAGVQFTEQQKAQIAALVESNDLLGAQKIVLREVESQVGGAAGASKDSIDELKVAFGNFEEALGGLVLPAVENLADVAANDLIPALEQTGSVVGDAAEAFNELPTPLKAAAASLATIAILNKTIGFTALSSGASRASSAFDGLRLRTMLAADAFRQARTYSVEFNGNLARISPQLSRTAASMAAMRVAATGFGSALGRGLSGVVGALGGPWGIAIAGGITALSVFASKHAKAAAEAEELKGTLDQQTGAITKNTRALVAKRLEEDHVLESAQKLGIDLSTVTDAALGQADAMAKVNAIINPTSGGLEALREKAAAAGVSAAEFNDAYNDLNNALGSVDIQNAVAEIQRQAEATKKSKDETEKVVGWTDRYAVSVSQLKDQLYGEQKASDAARNAHNRLADALSKSITGNINYKQAVHDAFKEAKDGAKTLDINTEAGRKNFKSLLNVSNAWNELSDKTKSAKGKYAEVRQEFIKVAEALGATERKAKRLADRLLDLPKKTIEIPIKLTTVNSGRKQGVALPGFAAGGKIGGYGGNGDKQLVLADRREWIINPRASAFYGDQFLDAINNMRVPRFAGGGPVTTSPRSYSTSATHNYHVYGVQSMRELDREAQRRSRAAANGSPEI